MSTVKQGISDAVFRAKLYSGSAGLGAFFAVIFYALYPDFSGGNLVETLQVVLLVVNRQPGVAAVMATAGGLLAFWCAWMLAAKPWRGAPDAPEAADHGVQKPW